MTTEKGKSRPFEMKKLWSNSLKLEMKAEKKEYCLE